MNVDLASMPRYLLVPKKKTRIDVYPSGLNKIEFDYI